MPKIFSTAEDSLPFVRVDEARNNDLERTGDSATIRAEAE